MTRSADLSRGKELSSVHPAMKLRTPDPDQQAMHVPPLGAKYRQLTLCLLSSAVLCLGITKQSLWIDEGYTVWYASHESITSVISTLLRSPGDSQMCLYFVYMWVWVKVWGTSEVALRAANIPFAILLVATISWASRRLFRRPNAWLLVCLSPFLWFYMNEARPYVALMALSAVSLVAILAYLTDPVFYKVIAPWCCLSGLLLAWGTHILAAFLFPSLVFMLAATARRDVTLRRTFLRDWSPSFLFHLPGFAALGAFYAWTAAHGENVLRGEPGLANLAFLFYEFMGFAGLGPPRNDLRDNPHLYAFIEYWPWLLVGVAAVVTLGLFQFFMRPTLVARNLAGSLFFGIAVSFALSKVAHFRFWGRHMAVFFPMLLIVLMLWAQPTTLSRRRQVTAATLAALGIVWGISDARLIFLRKYEKDSYRAASSIALERARLRASEILWAADTHVAYYYGLQVNSRPGAAQERTDIVKGVTWPVRIQAIDAENWSVEEATSYLGARTTPAILVLSKADLFDAKGGWRTLIRQQKPAPLADLNAFRIYEWGPKVEPTGMANLPQR